MYKVQGKGTLTFKELKEIVEYENGKFVSKSGDEYVDGLTKIFDVVNANDKPFTVNDIIKQPKLAEFKFPGVKDYIYIADLKVKPLELIDIGNNTLNRSNEKINVLNFTSNKAKEIFEKSLGVAYLLTAIVDEEEYIIKFGQTRTSFKKRLSSYNCGTVNAWRTASTTNIKMLQSMVTTRKRAKFKLYIYDCSDDVNIYTWHGIESVPFASPKSLAVEDIIINQFISQFEHKPLANIQAGATEID